MSEQPLTYEGIMEMIREGIRETQELRRSMKERDAEYARLMKEQAAEYAREKKERDAEYEKLRQKTEREVERANRAIGKLGNRIGEIVEHMIGERIIEKFQALGYNVTHPVVRNCSFSSAKLGLYGEFDLTLVDSDIIILIEVKTTLETSDVRKHLKR